MSPLATIGGGDPPSVELAGDGVEACMTGGPVLPNDRYDVGRKLRRLRLAGRAHAFNRTGRVPNRFLRGLAAARAALVRSGWLPARVRQRRRGCGWSACWRAGCPPPRTRRQSP
jgi:hypothetical protein